MPVIGNIKLMVSLLVATDNETLVKKIIIQDNLFLLNFFQIYVGNLGNNVSKYELEDIFNRYGKLRNVWVARNPPGSSLDLIFGINLCERSI